MKRTLQVVSAALLLAVASVTAQAQGGGGGGGGGGRGAAQREAMFKDITLTDAQKAKIDTLFTAAQAKSAEMRQAMQGGQATEEQMTKMRAVNTDRNDAIKKVLTAEQLPKFEENLKNMPQGRGRGGQ